MLLFQATGVFRLPISLLAFAEAGYRTVVLFPILGSSVAKIFPVAENIKSMMNHFQKLKLKLQFSKNKLQVSLFTIIPKISLFNYYTN